LKRHKQRKMDMRFSIWNVMSTYKGGSLILDIGCDCMRSIDVAKDRD
jgi:hypothetical protein